MREKISWKDWPSWLASTIVKPVKSPEISAGAIHQKASNALTHQPPNLTQSTTTSTTTTTTTTTSNTTTTTTTTIPTTTTTTSATALSAPTQSHVKKKKKPAVRVIDLS